MASQANSLFYLDPHLTRPAVPLEIPPKADPKVQHDTEDPIVVDQPSPIDQDPPVQVPYKLDVVDVDDLSSEGESDTSSPSKQPRHRKRLLEGASRLRHTHRAVPSDHLNASADALPSPMAPDGSQVGFSPKKQRRITFVKRTLRLHSACRPSDSVASIGLFRSTTPHFPLRES